MTAAGHPDEADAWFGLAQARRYQKGRRDDTLAAFERALDAALGRTDVWDAYLEYATYGITVDGLLMLTERIPPGVQADYLDRLLSVADGRDRWGGMPPAGMWRRRRRRRALCPVRNLRSEQ
ncbi:MULTISPECIES: hypothetical protein [unclassified Frankia]|uniref:hypothetical protein n=1 Tax=unclassified Frankia TaxID=2632575 RepID=UPI002AD2B15E|nr:MULTISPECIES: hypothetical protein [unclassified Frankia]